MTAHNDLLLAAAIAGINSAVLEGEDYSQISATSLATPAGVAQQAQILAAAQAVDQAIPADAALSVSTSNPVMLVTMFAGTGAAAAILPVFSKFMTCFAICKSAFTGRSLALNSGGYSAIVAGIAAQYANAVGQLPVS